LQDATYHFYCLNQLALERSLEKGMHVGLYAADFKIFSVIAQIIGGLQSVSVSAILENG